MTPVLVPPPIFLVRWSIHLCYTTAKTFKKKNSFKEHCLKKSVFRKLDFVAKPFGTTKKLVESKHFFQQKSFQPTKTILFYVFGDDLRSIFGE